MPPEIPSARLGASDHGEANHGRQLYRSDQVNRIAVQSWKTTNALIQGPVSTAPLSESLHHVTQLEAPCRCSSRTDTLWPWRIINHALRGAFGEYCAIFNQSPPLITASGQAPGALRERCRFRPSVPHHRAPTPMSMSWFSGLAPVKSPSLAAVSRRPTVVQRRR